MNDDLLSKRQESPEDMEPTINQPNIALIGLPTDENSSSLRGAATAPPLIRAALAGDASNWWSESGLDLEGRFIDLGDLALSTGVAALAEIEEALAAQLSHGRPVLSLGGDHFVTYPILRAHRHFYPQLGLLHFDAHPDLYDEFQGNRYSHACPFARIMEEGLVDRLVQVGIRTASAHQRAQAARFGVEMIEMKDWRDDLDLHFEMPVYLSFDIDGLDPSCAPGVSHREPGGLTTRQAINLIQRLKGKVIGADVVEYNPRADLDGMTSMVAAKLVKELAARMIIDAGDVKA
jgi:agmatinase